MSGRNWHRPIHDKFFLLFYDFRESFKTDWSNYIYYVDSDLTCLHCVIPPMFVYENKMKLFGEERGGRRKDSLGRGWYLCDMWWWWSSKVVTADPVRQTGLVWLGPVSNRQSLPHCTPRQPAHTQHRHARNKTNKGPILWDLGHVLVFWDLGQVLF